LFATFFRPAYLINAARNVARTSAVSRYVLSSDVELFPSPNLATNFEKFIKNKKTVRSKLVYVVPTFEIDTSESDRLPKSRSELVQFYKIGKVVYFHTLICKQCQKFPKLIDWIEKNIKPGKNMFYHNKLFSRFWEKFIISKWGRTVQP